MMIIQARVAWFQYTSSVLDKKYYQIICNDWKSSFYSEEIIWKTYWYDDYPLKYLHALNIIYDVKNPQKTLYELDNHPKKMMLAGWYQVTSDRLAKQIAWGENYQHPYWIFNDRKVSVWDTINVYIDPNNNKSYLVDLSFLK